MNKLVLLGTDGKQYEVIVLIDSRTGKPLTPESLALIATEKLESGIFDSDSAVLLSDPRLIELAKQVFVAMQKDPDLVNRFRRVTWHPLP